MNILLIGNGFDLAHGLPTYYNDFLGFCQGTRRIYNSDRYVSSIDYNKKLESWVKNNENKNILSDAFDKRICMENNENGTNDIEVTTPNATLEELYTHLKDNTWLNYFWDCLSNKEIGDNWIDFESEISKVIQALNEERLRVKAGVSVTNDKRVKSEILTSICKKAEKLTTDSDCRDVISIDKFTDFLNTDLERLIRALEIYIAEFVCSITVNEKCADIEKLNPDHVLSFNYTDTYERIYGKEKKIEYDYIHGKAEINNNVTSSNLVLGIDEYLEDESKDKKLEFLTFKKFYQRIYKSTGNAYLNWVDEIKDGYADFLKIKSDANARIVQSLKDGSFNSYPNEKKDCMELLNAECPQHKLYIFGHSLDMTDRDILKLFICNENVQTKIYYYRENVDDKKTLGKLIRNLIHIMGQDELIRRTGGVHKTIEFIPQTL